MGLSRWCVWVWFWGKVWHEHDIVLALCGIIIMDATLEQQILMCAHTFFTVCIKIVILDLLWSPLILQLQTMPGSMIHYKGTWQIAVWGKVQIITSSLCVLPRLLYKQSFLVSTERDVLIDGGGTGCGFCNYVCLLHFLSSVSAHRYYGLQNCILWHLILILYLENYENHCCRKMEVDKL